MSKSDQQSSKNAKSFLTSQQSGMLSTISSTHNGYPFGSIVPYDIDELGQIYIYISLIAEHYRNLKADKRASLIAADYFGWNNPQAHSRLTLLADFEIVSEEDKPKVQANYESRFPDSISYELAHNFVFFRGKPVKARWIEGFGKISWIDGETFMASQVDILAYSCPSILDHMNQDHREALAKYVAKVSNSTPATHQVQMTSISSDGISIRVDSGSGRKSTSKQIEVAFPTKITQLQDVRTEMIKLLKHS